MISISLLGIWFCPIDSFCTPKFYFSAAPNSTAPSSLILQLKRSSSRRVVQERMSFATALLPPTPILLLLRYMYFNFLLFESKLHSFSTCFSSIRQSSRLRSSMLMFLLKMLCRNSKFAEPMLFVLRSSSRILSVSRRAMAKCSTPRLEYSGPFPCFCLHSIPIKFFERFKCVMLVFLLRYWLRMKRSSEYNP